jgi:hypothetical protein
MARSPKRAIAGSFAAAVPEWKTKLFQYVAEIRREPRAGKNGPFSPLARQNLPHGEAAARDY